MRSLKDEKKQKLWFYYLTTMEARFCLLYPVVCQKQSLYPDSFCVESLSQTISVIMYSPRIQSLNYIGYVCLMLGTLFFFFIVFIMIFCELLCTNVKLLVLYMKFLSVYIYIDISVYKELGKTKKVYQKYWKVLYECIQERKHLDPLFAFWGYLCAAAAFAAAAVVLLLLAVAVK